MDSPRSSAEDTAPEFAEVCSSWVGGGMSLQKCNKKLMLLGALEFRNYVSAARVLEAVCGSERQKCCHQNSGKKCNMNVLT